MFVMIYRSFKTDAHEGLTMENIKGCAVDELIRFSPGQKCSLFKRDFWIVTVDIADHLLAKIGLDQAPQKKKEILQ